MTSSSICGYIPSWEDITWKNIGTKAEWILTPKRYLKLGGISFLWGQYLPPLAKGCEVVSSLAKKVIAPFIIAEVIKAGCKLGVYVDDVKKSDGQFKDKFIQGVIKSGGFTGKLSKCIRWLSKISILNLSQMTMYRLDILRIGSSFVKSSLELFESGTPLLKKHLEGSAISLKDPKFIDFIKALTGSALSILSICALYQATAVIVFLGLFFKTCQILLDFGYPK